MAYGVGIYTSSDYGATWTAQSAAAGGDWGYIASSASGQYLEAATYSGDAWSSSDYGVTWTEQTDGPSTDVYSIAISGDGHLIAAAPYGGDMYTAVNPNIPAVVTNSGGSSQPSSSTTQAEDTTKVPDTGFGTSSNARPLDTLSIYSIAAVSLVSTAFCIRKRLPKN